MSVDRDPPPELFQRLPTRATWDDLILPAGAIQSRREIAEHVRLHGRVLEDWGLSGKTSRGKGLCALFVGPSGTGKTLAAEVIANDLALDLYRIDLSQVVSKYIGETEKVLARLFEAAEASGAILFFGEADALFDRRSAVKDSHDLDFGQLAKLELSGGAIRDIALRATLEASAAGGAVTLPLILEAAAAELRKLGLTLDARDA